MFKALGSLFGHSQQNFSEQDIRQAAQHYLQREAKTDQILCQSARAGLLEIRVGNAGLHQEVKLLEYDLKKYLRETFHFEVKRVRVFTG